MLNDEMIRLDPKKIFKECIRNTDIIHDLKENQAILILDFFSKAYYNDDFDLEKGLENLLRELV